jgi:hypothetical protein
MASEPSSSFARRESRFKLHRFDHLFTFPRWAMDKGLYQTWARDIEIVN